MQVLSFENLNDASDILCPMRTKLFSEYMNIILQTIKTPVLIRKGALKQAFRGHECIVFKRLKSVPM
jgi:hypothetical protein